MRIAARNTRPDRRAGPPWPARPGQDPLSLRARVVVRLFVLAPILAFLIASLLEIVKVARLVNTDIGNVVASVLHQTLRHEFKIGGIEYLEPGVVRIDDLAISSKPTWKEGHGETGLSVRRVVIRYDFQEILSDPSSAANAVRTITFDHPIALVERYAQKQFNFTDLIPKKKRKHAKPFMAKIDVVEGTVRYRDYTAPVDPNGLAPVNTVYNLNGDVDCDSDELITFRGSGVGKNRFSTLQAVGRVSRRKPLQYTIDGSVTNGDAAYWTHFLRLVPQAQVLGGRADVRFSVLVPPSTSPPAAIARVGRDVLILGQGTVRGGSVNWLDKTILLSPLRDIAGRFSFTDTEVDIAGGLSINGQPLNVAGTIGIPPTATSPPHAAGADNGMPIQGYGHGTPMPPPTVSLTLESRAVDLRRLAAGFRDVTVPSGVTMSPASGRLLAMGPATDPVIAGDVEVGSVAYAGNRAMGVRVSLQYAHKLLGVQSAPFSVNGTGRANVVAAYDLTNPGRPTYTASGQADGIDLTSLHFPVQPAVRSPKGSMKPVVFGGKLSGQFIAQDSGTGARVTSNVTVDKGMVGATPVQALRGRVIWTQNRSVDLDKVVVEAAGGRALVSGTVSLNTPRPQLALSINAANVNVAQAVAPFSPADVSGIAYYNGLLAGPVDNPTATGSIHLFRAHYGRYGANVIRGDITANRDHVRIYDLHIQRFPAEADIAGNITGIATGKPQLALKATLSGVELDDLGRLLGENGRRRAAKLLPKGASTDNLASAFSGLEGEMEGNFSINGALEQPVVAGHVQIKDITVGGNRIDTAQADVSITDQEVRLRRIVLRSVTQRATETATGDLAWWPHTGKIEAVAAGSDIEIYRFRSLYAPYADIRGKFDFSGSMAGTLSNPLVTFGVVASDVSIDGQQLAQFTGFGKYEDGVLSSDVGPWDFTLLVPQTSTATTAAAPAVEQIDYSLDKFQVSIPAAVGRKGEPTFDIEAHIPDDSPERLTHLIDTLEGSKFASTDAVTRIVDAYQRLPRPTDAVIAVPSLTVKGSPSNLVAHANVSLTNIVCGQNRAGSVDASITYDAASGQSVTGILAARDIAVAGMTITSVDLNGGYAIGPQVVTVNDLRVGYEGAYLDAEGKAALDGDIDASLDVSNLPLSVFNPLMPRSRLLSGQIGTLSAVVTGLTQSPDVQATISIENPDIVLATAGPAVGAPKTAIASTPDSGKIDEIKSETISITTPAAGGSKILTIDDLAAYRAGSRLASVSGQIPFRWNRLKWDNLQSTLASLPTDQPLHAELTVNDLSVLRLVSPSIDPKRTGGTLIATVDANDRSHASSLTGSIKIENASLGLLENQINPDTQQPYPTPSAIDTSLEDVNAEVSFDLNGAKIVSFTGKSSEKGSFNVTGGVKFGSASNLDLMLALDSFEFNEHTRQSFLSRTYGSAAQGKITGAVAITGPFDAPTISNPKTKRVVVAASTLGIPSAPEQTGSASPTYAVDPNFDVYLQIGAPHQTVTVKNALLSADVSGNAEIAGSMSAPVFDSDLTINKGRVTLAGPVLRIAPGGTVRLHYPTPNTDASPMEPQNVLSELVDITATTTVSASPSDLAASTSGISGAMGGGPTVGALTSVDTQRTNYRITVVIQGYLGDKNLTTDYSSEPHLDKAQILALLTPQTALLGILRGGSGSGDVVAQQLTAIVNSVGVGMLLNPVETNIAEALGLSSFVVDYSPDAPVVVTLTKPLGHRLEASFERSFGSRDPDIVNELDYDPLYQVKLSFSLTRRLQISLSRDDLENTTLSLEGVLGF